jgi:hypothetical protein
MRHGLIGLTTALLLGATLATGGCSSTSNNGGSGGGAGGSVSGTGGTSGGTGGGSGNSVTSVSGTKTIGSLSAAEATQLCNDTYFYLDTAIPHATACKWNGLYRAASSSSMTTDQLRTGCSLAENSCLASDAGAFSNPGCGDLPKTCTATVAQYATCIADEVTAFNQTVNGFPSCMTVTMAGTGPIFDALAGGTPPASCTSLGDACPSLLVPNPLTPN